MIENKEFLSRLQDLTRKYQSAFETGDAVTGKINQAQLELAEYLYSIYEINQRAIDLLSPLILTVPITSDASGIIELPEDYNHKLAVQYNEFPANYIGTNQSIIERLPQRKGNLAKNRVNYTFKDKGMQLFPKQAILITLTYVKYPTKAKIVYTYQSTAQEDIRVYDEANSQNMEWNMNCFNLLLYMTLDKMGISIKDELLKEYAQLGIAKEEIKPLN